MSKLIKTHSNLIIKNCVKQTNDALEIWWTTTFPQNLALIFLMGKVNTFYGKTGDEHQCHDMSSDGTINQS